MHSTELTPRLYAAMRRFFESMGATLHVNEHEGSTLDWGGMHLCESDGSYWLMGEVD